MRILSNCLRWSTFVPAIFPSVNLTRAEEVCANPERKLRLMVFGAHSDDAELGAGGVAAKRAKQGHRVNWLSVLKGDIGRWRIKSEAFEVCEYGNRLSPGELRRLLPREEFGL